MKTEQVGGLRTRVTGGSDGEGGGDGPVIVLLHGYGAPGEDLVPLWRAIDAPRGARFVFPEAPLALDRMGSSRAWWNIDMMRLQMAMATGQPRDTAAIPDGLVEARGKVVALLEAIPARFGVGMDRVVLGGFSQGAMLSTDVMLRLRDRLAGLVLMSGTLIAAEEWLPLMPARSGTRVLQSHGREDELLPFVYAELLRDHLVKAGLEVEFIPFRGGHTIPSPVLDRLGSFLRTVLP